MLKYVLFKNTCVDWACRHSYWNTDTGGFGGGDWQTMGELVVRWFQFSIFTSITRLHGDRHPKGPGYTGAPLAKQCDPTGAAGGPVEPWAYGPSNAHALDGVKAALRLKRSLQPCPP